MSKKPPAQPQAQPITHKGKSRDTRKLDHEVVVESVKDAKADPQALARALADRKKKTGQTK